MGVIGEGRKGEGREQTKMYNSKKKSIKKKSCLEKQNQTTTTKSARLLTLGSNDLDFDNMD